MEARQSKLRIDNQSWPRAAPAHFGPSSNKRRKCLHWPEFNATKTTQAPISAKVSNAAFKQQQRFSKFLGDVKKGQPLSANTDLQQILNVSSEQELKALLNCLLLSECAYKIADLSEEAATDMVQRVKQTFPTGVISIERVQWSQLGVYHRYMLAEDSDTLYVAFMGTKQRRDLVANAAVLQVPLWPDMSDQLVPPAAHRGFLSRARGIPIEGLYAHACRLGKRLVLTGHSLGGSVAQISLLKLLKQLPDDSEPAIRSVTFACPAIGNQALADFAVESGWEDYFQNYLIPEDLVPRLLASPEQSPEQVASAAIDALQPEEARHIGDASVGSTLRMFNDIYDVVLNDDPYQVPLSFQPDPQQNPTGTRQKTGSKSSWSGSLPFNAHDNLQRQPDASLASSVNDSSRFETNTEGPGTDRKRQPKKSKQKWKSGAARNEGLYGRYLQADEQSNGELGHSIDGKSKQGNSRRKAASKAGSRTGGSTVDSPRSAAASKQAASLAAASAGRNAVSPQRGKSDKEKAIEAADLFEQLESFRLQDPPQLQEPEGSRLNGSPQAFQSSSGNPRGPESSADLDAEEQLALARMQGEDGSIDESSGADDSSEAGPAGEAGESAEASGRLSLASEEEVFFPWSSNPVPPFAKGLAGRALKSASSLGRLKNRPLPFFPRKSTQAESNTRQDQERSGSGLESKQPPRNKTDKMPDFPAVYAANGKDISLTGGDWGPDKENQSVAAAESIVGNILEMDADSDLDEVVMDEEVEEAMQNGKGRTDSGWRGKIPIQRLSANMGKAASGAAKKAARLVGAPLGVVQRRYAVLGKQAFLSPAGVVPVSEGDSEQTFQTGLEGAKETSRASLMALPASGNASPNTIVSLQLPLAAARRRQPFLMHKMAFHRARVLSILECTLTNMGHSLPSDQQAPPPAIQCCTDLAPPMAATKAEVFLPYSLPDDSDLKAILDDLGSLSALPPMTSAIRQSMENQRFKWLKPWRWISGLGWGRSANKRGMVELTAQIRGVGLENCSFVQVREQESGVWCQTEVIYRPPHQEPAQTYRTLGPHLPKLVWKATVLASQAKVALKYLASVLDRTNAMRRPDRLLVKIYLPLEVMMKMENRLLQQSDESSGLTVHLTSDFREVQVPLSVHGGGSWVISDIRSSSQLLDEWLNHNVSG